MLRILAWIEIILSIGLLALSIWPFSGLCSGRFIGLDCESQMIFAINMFGPLGVLALICSIWSLKSESLIPQYILLLGFTSIMGYWLFHMI